MTWDFKLLCIRGKTEFYISFTKGEMRDVLLRLGFSYTRPTYSLARSNREKQKILKKQIEKLKKLIDATINHFLFQDGSSIRDYHSLVGNWFLKGNNGLSLLMEIIKVSN